jgi:hypothetical protein
VRYDDWENIPAGFAVQVESLASQMLNPFFSGDVLPSGKYNCTGLLKLFCLVMFTDFFNVLPP